MYFFLYFFKIQLKDDTHRRRGETSLSNIQYKIRNLYEKEKWIYTLFEIQKKSIYLSLSHFLCLTGCINMAKVETKTSVGKEFSFSQYIPGPFPFKKKANRSNSYRIRILIRNCVKSDLVLVQL